MALNRIRDALGGLFGSRQSRSATAADKKPAALPESKKVASSNEQKLVVRSIKPSSFEQQLPCRLQQTCVSFLAARETLTFLRVSKQLRENHSSNYQPARAQQALSNLVHRLRVEVTLAAIKRNPDILDTLKFPFKLAVTGHGGHTVSGRPSLMSALDALDEYDVTKLDAKAEPCAIIPSIRALFPGTDPVQAKIDQQIADASSPAHQLATQKRHQRYLEKIRKFILAVINCDEITNDPNPQRDFESVMKTKLVQDFIQTAFQLNDAENKGEFDKGELGVALDVWQLLHDYVYLFNQYIDAQDIRLGTNGNYYYNMFDALDMRLGTVREDAEQPILGRYMGRKAWVVDTAVCLAVHRFAQLCHLEVLDAGANLVADGQKRPLRFNMRDKECLRKLEDIRVGTHVFGFFGGRKYYCTVRGVDLGSDVSRRVNRVGVRVDALICETFVKQRQQQKCKLTQQPKYRKR